MSTWHRKTGDVKDTVVVALYGVDDISTVSAVQGHVKLGATQADLTGTVTNAAATATDPCAVTLQLGAVAAQPWLPTAAAGRWRLETELTFSDGTIKTWPEADYDTIVVTSQADT